MHKIGIDLGGTKIEGILLDEKYNTIQRKRIETHQENGYDSIVKSITSLVNELALVTPGVHIPTDIPSFVFAFNSFTKDVIDFTIES
jgi:fructokinase